MGPRGVAQILDVLRRLFEGADRVQALFGLITNDSFRGSLGDALPSIDKELASAFGPLVAAHRAVFEGSRGDEDADDKAVAEGIEKILAAPEAVLRSYAEPVRARLAALAIELGSESKEAIKRLMHGLPLKDPAYVELRRLRVEQLLREGAVDDARGLVNQVAGEAPWAATLKGALNGKVVGRVVVGGPITAGSRVMKALWLDKPGLVYARTAQPADAGTLAFEAKVQAECTLPMIAPIIAHGMASDGMAFVAIAPIGPAFTGPADRWPLEGRLHAALEGVRLASSLAERGLVLPDLQFSRFLSSGGRFTLADFSGVSREEPGRATVTMAPHATAFAAAMLAGAEVPRALGRRLRTPAPMVLLMRALSDALVDV